MLRIEGGLYLPINKLPPRCLSTTEDHGTRRAGNVLLSNSADDIGGIIGVQKAVQRMVLEDIIIEREGAQKIPIISLIISMMIANEDLPPRKRPIIT